MEAGSWGLQRRGPPACVSPGQGLRTWWREDSAPCSQNSVQCDQGDVGTGRGVPGESSCRGDI